MECAGKDISCWFDPETKDVSVNRTNWPISKQLSALLLVHLHAYVVCPQVLKYVDPLTNCVRYYTPRGRFVHVPPAGPRSDWASDIGQPWWRNKRYEVGLLSAKTRWIRVINTLTSQEQRLQVNCPHTPQLLAVGWTVVVGGATRVAPPTTQKVLKCLSACSAI